MWWINDSHKLPPWRQALFLPPPCIWAVPVMGFDQENTVKVMLWQFLMSPLRSPPFPLSSSSLTPPSELTQLINTPAVAIRNASIFCQSSPWHVFHWSPNSLEANWLVTVTIIACHGIPTPATNPDVQCLCRVQSLAAVVLLLGTVWGGALFHGTRLPASQGMEKHLCW